MNIDKDSVVNFLTPTKLVHSALKHNKPRVSLQESQQSNSSRRYDNLGEIPPYSFTAQFDRLNRDIDRSRDRVEESLFVDPREKSRPPTERNNILNETSKTVLKSEENYKGYVESRQEESKGGSSKPTFSMHPVEYTT